MPLVDRRQHVGHESRCGPGNTGDLPGGGVPYPVRELGRQLRDRLLGEIDAFQFAVEPAQMDLWLGLRG